MSFLSLIPMARRYISAAGVSTALTLVQDLNFQLVASTIPVFLRMANSQDGSESKNAAILARHFDDSKSANNLEAFLCQSSTFDRARLVEWVPNKPELKPPRKIVNELSAKLHCLYGVPIHDDWLEDKDIRPFACSRTYDLRNYSQENLWGPFKDDGSMEVDWEKVEAVMIILRYNIKQHLETVERSLAELWRRPFHGAWPNSYKPALEQSQHMPLVGPFPKLPALRLTPVNGDPYGVTGTWMRVVCFLDYREFFRFNFGSIQPERGEPRPAYDWPEATRVITMQIVATDIQPPGEKDGKDYPVVSFKGISRTTHHAWDPNANSLIRGDVRQTPEGEIRWTTFSIYYDEERWRSEGVQVGGIRSGRGVFGHWFDRNYDPEGPAGPTAFWKVSDEYDADKVNETDSEDDSDYHP